MFNYIGHTCDVCNEKFTAQSDVVVCPECGTPHHRECYKQLGHCVNEAKHAEGFEYAPPQAAEKPNTITCPKCGAANPKDVAFCESCGISLADGSHKSHPSPEEFKQQARSTFVPPVVPVGMEGEKDGVTYKDMALYIGPSYAYYIHGFKRLQKEPKTKIFCWSAFFFDGIYFLYRKMWPEAILILLAGLVLGAPSMIVLAESMGIISSSSPLIFKHLDLVVTLGSVLSMMLKMWLGFVALPRYEKKVLKDLKRIKTTSSTTAEYYQKVVDKSGPSKVVLVLGAVMFVAYLFI